MKLSFLLLFVSSILVLVSPDAGAETKVVPSGAFPTIQSAVDAASPNDVILVKKGTYTENVVIDSKFFLTLKGKKKVTIDGSGGGNQCLSVNNCAGLTIQNIRMKNGLTHAVTLLNSDDVLFKNCTVLGGPGAGIRVFSDCAQVDVNGCVIQDVAGNGLNSSSDDLFLRGTKIQNVGGNGITLTGNRITVKNCTVIGSGALGVEIAANGTATTNALLVDNRFENTGDDSIQVDAMAAHVTLLDNTSVGSQAHGLDVISGSAGVSVLGNKFIKPDGTGMFCTGNGGIYDANATKKTGAHGIHLQFGVIGNMVSNNSFTKSNGNAVRVAAGTSDNAFLGNTHKKTVDTAAVDSSASPPSQPLNAYIGNNFVPVFE